MAYLQPNPLNNISQLGNIYFGESDIYYFIVQRNGKTILNKLDAWIMDIMSTMPHEILETKNYSKSTVLCLKNNKSLYEYLLII